MRDIEPVLGLINLSRYAVRYLTHPEVVEIPFCLSSNAIGKQMKKAVEATESLFNGMPEDELEIIVYRDFLDRAGLHTIIAALRHYQQEGFGDPDNRPLDIHDLATNGGDVMSSLDDEGIDQLIEDLNC